MVYNMMTHIIDPKLTHRQRQIIIGTILGGSSIVKPSGGRNSYLSMRGKDADWLEYKAIELKGLTSNKPFTIEKTNRWHSLCYPLFNEYRDMFYSKGQRKLTLNVLEECYLSDIAFSIWYGDCCKYDRGHIIINTHIWKESGTKAVVKFFDLMDMKAEVYMERSRFRVKLDEVATREIMKLIQPHLPYFYVTRRSTPFRRSNRDQ